MTEGERVLLTYANGEVFTYVNPFKIADEIRRLVGEVESARPDRRGNLIITTFARQQTEILLQQDHFLNQKTTFDSPRELNSTEAHAFAPTLIDVEDDIIKELRNQGVIGVTRLRPKNGQKQAGLRIRILGNSIPAEIRAGFQDIALRPWRITPLLCRRCAATPMATPRPTATQSTYGA